MPPNFSPRVLKLKRGEISVQAKGNLTVCWKDKREVYMLSNIHPSPAQGQVMDDSGRSIKPKIVEDYNTHMGYVDMSDRMANSYSICRRTWKWTKKLFFHLLDLSVLNAFIVQQSCGGKLTHKRFREQLIRDLIHAAQDTNITASGVQIGRPSPVTSQLSHLEFKHSKHWPAKGNKSRCRVCSHSWCITVNRVMWVYDKFLL
jgi:hypothetical protein